jgi:acyl dehydratase
MPLEPCLQEVSARPARSAKQSVSQQEPAPSAPFNLDNADQYIGQELGVSEWIRMDQERISAFADCTGDHQWIHVDAERAARESPFRSTIAHGFLTLSIVAPTALDIWIKPSKITTVLNYGMERVRFIAPVPCNARVRNRIRLLAVTSKGDGRVLVSTENTVEIEGQEKPALVAQVLLMALPN